MAAAFDWEGALEEGTTRPAYLVGEAQQGHRRCDVCVKFDREGGEYLILGDAPGRASRQSFRLASVIVLSLQSRCLRVRARLPVSGCTGFGARQSGISRGVL